VILPDVNLLLYAHNADAPQHAAARAWWDAVLNGTEPVALPWVVVLAFVRITTNRRAFSQPTTPDEALTRVSAWLARPHVRIVHPTDRHFELVATFLRRAGTAGNLTTDAHLAALAIEHGATLWSTDRDFARFPGLDRRDPLSA